MRFLKNSPIEYVLNPCGCGYKDNPPYDIYTQKEHFRRGGYRNVGAAVRSAKRTATRTGLVTKVYDRGMSGGRHGRFVAMFDTAHRRRYANNPSVTYTVYDALTGDALAGRPSKILIEKSDEADAGIVSAYKDIQGVWQFVPASQVDFYKRHRGESVRPVYILY